jgi:hypothetical protein
MKNQCGRQNGRQTLTETGDSLPTLRILRPLRLGVCGEFSDYSLEGSGWSSGRKRLDDGRATRGDTVSRGLWD